MTLSIHIKETDAISCYLYWNGQMTRFMPRDIVDVLPKIFNMDWNHGENQMFLHNKYMTNYIINQMKTMLIDKHFNAFVESYL